MAHVLPSGGGKALMNVDDTALLLLDHQSGLFRMSTICPLSGAKRTSVRMRKMCCERQRLP